MSSVSGESSNSKKKMGLGRGMGSLLGGAQDSMFSSTKDILGETPAAAVVKTNTASSEPLSTQMKAEMPSQAIQTQVVAQPVVVQAIPDDARVWNISIEKLQSGTYQPRTTFDKDSLEELAQSIRSNGILQPIVARKVNDKLEIIAGERRWRAAQIAGLHEVPVIIKKYSDRETLELAIIENIQREDLNPIEEAESYQRLASEFALTQQQIAEKVGRDRATVANALRLLNLAPQVKQMLVNSEISVGHAKVLLAINEPLKQTDAAKKIVAQKLNVRKAEKLIIQMNTQATQGASVQPAAANKEELAKQMALNLAEDLQRRLGTRVAIDYSAGKGKLSIYFYSNEELNNLVEGIKETCQP